MEHMARRTATLAAGAARLSVGAIFVVAGALKARDPAAFAVAVDHYRLLPYPAAVAVALYLPWLEIVCGAGVLWRRARLGALNLLLGLCVVFSGALASAWWRHLDIACGCFGADAGGRSALLLSLGRSLALGLVCGILLRCELQAARPPAADPA
jgi:putative oxidoreductase